MTTCAYLRVSDDQQVESGLGLDAQRRMIDGYCALKALSCQFFTDPAVSGGIPLADRPAGSSLLYTLRKGGILIAAKLDRLFRSTADASISIADFDKRGISLVLLSEGIDASTPFGKAMIQMAAVFAELERSMIRERTANALAVKKSRGERVSRFPPFGWDIRGDMLVVNAIEQEAIQRMKEWAAEGKPSREIAALMEETGIKPKRGGRWAHTSVCAILKRGGGRD